VDAARIWVDAGNAELLCGIRMDIERRVQRRDLARAVGERGRSLLARNELAAPFGDLGPQALELRLLFRAIG